LPLVRADATSGDIVLSSRQRSVLPLALPATAGSGPAPRAAAEFDALRHGHAPALRREPTSNPQTESPLATASRSLAADRPSSREPAKLGAPEIGRVADRVYSLLVDQLARERQRRRV